MSPVMNEAVSLERAGSLSVAAKVARVAIIAAFPLSLTSPGTTVAMGLAAVCGLYLWVRAGTMPGDIARSGAITAGGYLLLLVIDVVNGGGPNNFLQTGVNYLPLLATAPLALAIRRSELAPEMIDRALQATVGLALIVSLVAWFSGEPRPGGINLNPIPYGFALLLAASLLLWRGIAESIASFFSVTMALLATIPILLTGSKIVWACTIVSYAITLIYWIVSQRRWWSALPVAAAFVGCLVIFYYAYAKGRLATLWAEAIELATNGVSMGGSLGHRVELMASGWRAFLEMPIFGHGFDERMTATFAHLTPGGPNVTIQGHLHNDYVTHLVSYGVFGGLFLVAYLVFFWRQASQSTIPAYRHAGHVFVVLLVMYMWVEVAFNMDPVSGPIAIILALLLASRVELGEDDRKIH